MKSLRQLSQSSLLDKLLVGFHPLVTADNRCASMVMPAITSSGGNKELEDKGSQSCLHISQQFVSANATSRQKVHHKAATGSEALSCLCGWLKKESCNPVVSVGSVCPHYLCFLKVCGEQQASATDI